MCSNLDYHTDGDDFNKMHHDYMMEIMNIIGSAVGENKVEYINVYKDVRFTNGYKWTPYLYKVKEFASNIYKSLNCVSETYVKDKLINKYKEARIAANEAIRMDKYNSDAWIMKYEVLKNESKSSIFETSG